MIQVPKNNKFRKTRSRLGQETPKNEVEPIAPNSEAESQQNILYKGSGRGGLSTPLSSVVGNALVMIDDGIESVNVKNRYQGARVSARRANREPEDGIRWKFVHGRVVVVR